MNASSLKAWETLIGPIPKLAVPVEFIKQIVFYYSNNEEIVLDVSEVQDDLKETVENWIETNYANSKKISMVVDIQKVRKFIEPITKEFLGTFFKN